MHQFDSIRNDNKRKHPYRLLAFEMAETALDEKDFNTLEHCYDRFINTCNMNIYISAALSFLLLFIRSTIYFNLLGNFVYIAILNVLLKLNKSLSFACYLSLYFFCTFLEFGYLNFQAVYAGEGITSGGRSYGIIIVYMLLVYAVVIKALLCMNKLFPSKINWLNLIIKTLVGILYLPIAFVVLSYIVAYLPPIIDIVFYNWVVMILSFAFIFAYLGFFPFGNKFPVFSPLYYSQERLD